MPIQRSQNRKRPSPPRADELPRGIAEARPLAQPDPGPPYAKGDPRARRNGIKGGKTSAGRTELADSFGLTADMNDARNRRAEAWRVQTIRWLRQNASGGAPLSPHARSCVKLAARALAAAERAYDEGRDREADGHATRFEACMAYAVEYSAARGKPGPAPAEAYDFAAQAQSLAGGADA